MHLYDFPEGIKKIVGNKDSYYDFIDKNYFNVCKAARVLEIAPFNGNHTKLIINHQPSYLQCIEADPALKKTLEKISGVDQVVIDDVWLKTDIQPFDVVICFGLLYHHHSALHLLELIANLYSPKYVMFDCVTAEHPLVYLEEPVNQSGSRQLRPEWKHCGLNLKPPFFVVNWAMHNLGYRLKLSNKLNSDFFPKSNGWVAQWVIKENS